MGDRPGLVGAQQSADPFGEGWRSRDLDRWIEALAPDVVLHSPVLSSAFRGGKVARDLYGVLFAAFGELTITDRARVGDTEIIAWCSELRGRTIEGVDVIRYGAGGDIVEIRVFIRPLVALGVFASLVGPAFARQRSRPAAALIRLLSAPLNALFAALDGIAPRLLPLNSPKASPELP